MATSGKSEFADCVGSWPEISMSVAYDSPGRIGDHERNDEQWNDVGMGIGWLITGIIAVLVIAALIKLPVFLLR
jgi:hypothetical protein